MKKLIFLIFVIFGIVYILPEQDFLVEKNFIEPIKMSEPSHIPQQRATTAIDPKQVFRKRDLKDIENDLNIQSYHQVEKVDSETPMGKTVNYHFQQQGIPIIGMEVVVEMKGRQVNVVKNNYRPIAEVDLNEKFMTLEEIMQKTELDKKQYSLELASKIIYIADHQKKGELAYVLPVYDSRQGKTLQAIFRARDGQILAKTYGRDF
jgi:hypothetical protein